MVHPGKVMSRNDGDIHYVTGVQLIRLYGLNPHTTIIATPDNLTGQRQEDFNHYYPRVDGKYEQH
jgi:hypothetical protein